MTPRAVPFLVVLAALSATALAGPPCHAPAYRPVVVPTYRPAAVVRHAAPAKIVVPVAVPVVVASPVLVVPDFVFDFRARDVFVFTGPPPAVPGTFAGVTGDGREARLLPAPAFPGDPPPAAPAGAAGGPPLAALRASCADCHQEGKKTRGGVALFDASGALSAAVDWRAALEAVSPSGKGPPRMPPPDSGKPALTPEALAAVRALAPASK